MTATRKRPVHVTENSTDATRGQPLAERVIVRKNALEQALANLEPDASDIDRMAIETAIATANNLLTGDLDHPSDVVAHELNNWLEANKHLAEHVKAPRQAARRA
jgi:hypothetical protein